MVELFVFTRRQLPLDHSNKNKCIRWLKNAWLLAIHTHGDNLAAERFTPIQTAKSFAEFNRWDLNWFRLVWSELMIQIGLDG